MTSGVICSISALPKKSIVTDVHPIHNMVVMADMVVILAHKTHKAIVINSHLVVAHPVPVQLELAHHQLDLVLILQEAHLHQINASANSALTTNVHKDLLDLRDFLVFTDVMHMMVLMVYLVLMLKMSSPMSNLMELALTALLDLKDLLDLTADLDNAV